MPRLSVIVMCSEDAESFENTLASVLQHRPGDCEVLAALAGAYSDPYNIGDEVRLVASPADAPQTAQLNNALRFCQSDVVHILQAGVEVEEGWADAALEHFEDPEVGAVAPVLLSGRSPQRIETLGILYGAGGSRRQVAAGRKISRGSAPRVHVHGPSLQAAFYRRELLEKTSGFDSSVGDHLADVDLAMTIKAMGYHCVAEPDCRVSLVADTSPKQQPGYRSGLQAQRLFWRQLPVVGGLRAFMMLPLSATWQSLLALRAGIAGVTHLLGRMAASLEFGQYRRHHRLLEELRAEQPIRAYSDQAWAPRTLSHPEADGDLGKVA